MNEKLSRVFFYLFTIITVLLVISLGNRTVTVLSEQAVNSGRTRIVIDPGHGGVDGGAVSCTGKPESAYNLEIALKLNANHHAPYDQGYTRATMA